MQDGKYAVIVTLQSYWNGAVIGSCFRFVITVNDNMGRNEVNTLVYQKAQEMTLEGLPKKLPLASNFPMTTEELQSDIIFMSIDPE